MKSKPGIKIALLLALTAIALNGCGGSSGGGSDDVGGLSYEGRTGPANVRSGNANDLTDNVVSAYGLVRNDNLSLKPAGSDVSTYVGNGFAIIDRLRKNLDAKIALSPANPMLASRTDVDLNLNSECDTGKWKVVGYVDEDNETAELTSILDACVIDGDRIDGELKFEVLEINLDSFSANDKFALDVRLSFEKLRVRNSEGDVSIGGTTRYKVDLVKNEERQTVIDLIILDNDSGDMLRIVNLVSLYSFDDVNSPGQVTIDIKSGRVFDSRYGYVDVDTPLVTNFASVSQEFPNAGLYELTANGSIIVSVIDANTVRIQADTDNDLGNGYEVDRTISWVDL